MEIEKIMTAKTVCVDRSETVSAAARLMSRYNVGALPVTDERGRLCGMLTDRDVALRCVAAGKDADKVLVRSIMTNAPCSLRPGQSCKEAVRAMIQNRVRRLPVTEQGRVVGMVSLGDLTQDPETGSPQALAGLYNQIHTAR